jgi:hypothetical protein
MVTNTESARPRTGTSRQVPDLPMSAAPNSNSALAGELTSLLSKTYPDIEVEVSLASRWNRPCVTFRSEGFASLLPEERFHRLLRLLPADLVAQKLAGFVWLELEPGQEVDAFLAEPRSEDVAETEQDIYREWQQWEFLPRLEEMLGPDPEKSCKGDFRFAVSVLNERRVSQVQLRDAKLVCIRQGVYCDCQILRTVAPELAKRYG